MNKTIFLLVLTSLLAGCATTPPSNPDNICAIFREKDDWYDDAADARDNWNSPIPVMMAIMHQESRFQAKAKPPRTYLLGFIPWTRPSDAYGYPQAKTATWKGYQRSSGNSGADRDDFDDAIDFIGWYNDQSYKKCSIKRDDPYHLYLAYHEGHGGFNRRTFKEKLWLKGVAKKVSARSRRYTSQLNSCEESLKASWWEFWR
jgi:hypothetical protein